MFRRSLTTLAVVVVAVTVLPGARGQTTGDGLGVRVRVEGKTQTIFGATEPRLQVQANALDALEAASRRGEFYYRVAQSPFGAYVDQIGRYPAERSSGWVFKVNGASPPVGATAVQLKNGDRVLWYHATFGATGGPRTLELRRGSRPGCYRVVSRGDAGKAAPASGAVLRVGRRTVKTRNGHACIGRHTGLVRATLKGAVRSNALP